MSNFKPETNFTAEFAKVFRKVHKVGRIQSWRRRSSQSYIYKALRTLPFIKAFIVKKTLRPLR